MERAPTLVSARDAAVVWHERLHRDKVSPDLKRDFDDWLAASPLNRQAYESVDRAWVTLRGGGEFPQLLALRHETAFRLTRQTSAHTRPWRWTVAAAAIVGIVVAGLSVYPVDRPLLQALFSSVRYTNHQRYFTATGERLSFTLADGSQVMLDTQSVLSVDFSATQRRVSLEGGQAFFEVAKDANRPFVVATHNRQFVAVGTAFDVRIDGDQVKVTMVEGTVRVEPVASNSLAGGMSTAVRETPSQKVTAGGSTVHSQRIAPIATITAGEQLVSDAHEDHVKAADPDRDTSWRRGQVIFENERLEDAVAEINRYSDVKIELSAIELNGLRLSGAFATGSPKVFVEAVTSYFPIKIQIADERRIILEKKN
jgi:transmembrane sensor